jgi:RNA polymerase sigma-70 factor (ECF subfamily)
MKYAVRKSTRGQKKNCLQTPFSPAYSVVTMSNPQIQAGYASVDEVKAAFIGLSGEDLLKLKQIARLRSIGLPTSTWEDLLQEALFRAFTGARQWPVSVPFLAFLAQTMRSISADERRRSQDVEVISEADLDVDENSTKHINNVAVTTITPESLVAARSALREIEQLFVGDREALQILEGLTLGSTPAEVQSASGMTTVQYSTAQKRIQRALAKRYGKE